MPLRALLNPGVWLGAMVLQPGVAAAASTQGSDGLLSMFLQSMASLA